MSVSLREILAEILNSNIVCKEGDILGTEEAIEQILSLFPTLLTKKELAETIYGFIAPILPLIKADVFSKSIASALIGKCATPTFSGEKGEYPCCNMAGTLCPIHGEYNQDVEDCIKGTFMDKPIPAEKKECEHNWYVNKTMTDFGEQENIKCIKCGQENYKPEPKPKDRIEELPEDITPSTAEELDRLLNLVLKLGALTIIPKELKDSQLKIIKEQIRTLLLGRVGK